MALMENVTDESVALALIQAILIPCDNSGSILSAML